MENCRRIENNLKEFAEKSSVGSVYIGLYDVDGKRVRVTFKLEK